MKALYVLAPGAFETLYPLPERDEIASLVDFYAPLQSADMLAENPGVLYDAEAVFSGWGCPPFDQRLLDAAPHLKIVFYGAGSVKSIVSDAFWQRGIQVTTAYAANAVPVVEYTLAHILFGLRSGWQHVMLYRQERTFVRVPAAGGYGSTVGIVSLGMIGSQLVERLRTFDVDILAYDPYTNPPPGVRRCSLEEIFERSDVVSIHTPWLPETDGLITGEHLASMKPCSTFINTARGAVVREKEMIDVLHKRRDLVAVLDVTHPEPPDPVSPLFSLPNVILTPHIAGAMGSEGRRLCQIMVSELKRYLAGKPLQYGLSRERVKTMA
ncbi:MAG: hydroxyacid dehydrogenase [Chloroflexota bacterium]